MKVIEEVNPKQIKFKDNIKIRCFTCGSLLEVDFNDTSKTLWLSYRQFKCPVCKHINVVSKSTFVIKED